MYIHIYAILAIGCAIAGLCFIAWAFRIRKLKQSFACLYHNLRWLFTTEMTDSQQLDSRLAQIKKFLGSLGYSTLDNPFFSAGEYQQKVDAMLLRMRVERARDIAKRIRKWLDAHTEKDTLALDRMIGDLWSESYDAGPHVLGEVLKSVDLTPTTVQTEQRKAHFEYAKYILEQLREADPGENTAEYVQGLLSKLQQELGFSRSTVSDIGTSQHELSEIHKECCLYWASMESSATEPSGAELVSESVASN